MASSATKTERITILGTPQFKAFLSGEAKKEGVSISELIRRRCQHSERDRDEEVLLTMAEQVRTATSRAKESLDKGLRDAKQVLAELQKVCR